MLSHYPVLLCVTCNQGVSLPSEQTSAAVRCANCGHVYQWHDGILVLDSVANQHDYPDDVYRLLAEIEPDHFWFSGRNAVIIQMLRRSIGALEQRSVLDIGCGTGFVLAAFERAGMTTCGLDMHLAGLRYARRRVEGLLLCQGAARIPFSQQFDIVTLCDVIEHVPDDSAVLREAQRALGKQGVVLVTVPANPGLWTVLDEVSGHKRRYTRETLTRAMERAGLRVMAVRYFNTLLLPIQRLQRRLLGSRQRGAGDDALQIFRQSLRVPPSPFNQIFRLAMAADVPLSRLPIPFGASLIAIGKPA